MKILVLNCGSSSIKYKLFEMTTKEILAQGGIEKIGLPGSFLKLTLPSGEKKIIEKDVPEHTTGVQFIFDTLTNAEYGAVKNLHEINAVGHRVLHGGTKFSGSVLINDAVIAAVEECCDLGPLHNPMGLTPLEGLMMGTRCGDIDGGAILYMMKKEGMTPDEMSNLLNKKSGVLGVFEKSSDMRELEDAVARGEERAILTENMYFYRITKYIGAYAAAMGGVDVILFTGGVGENQATARAGVCKTLGFMGVELDPEKNKVRGQEAIISTENSKVKVVVIPTDEELMIATDTMNILNNK